MLFSKNFLHLKIFLPSISSETDFFFFRVVLKNDLKCDSRDFSQPIGTTFTEYCFEHPIVSQISRQRSISCDGLSLGMGLWGRVGFGWLVKDF